MSNKQNNNNLNNIERTFSILVYTILTIILLMDMHFMYSKGRKAVEAEAIELNFGRWEADKDGSPKFKWNERM